MKLIIYLFLYTFFTFSLCAENIATIKISYIIENSTAFLDFMKNLDSLKDNINKKLSLEKEKLNERKNEIEESKSLLAEIEYSNLVVEFNEQAKIFENKIVKYEKNISNNIEYNEKIILDNISKITMDISVEQNLDLVINDDQYFIASNNIDISELVLERLNNLNINLENISKINE